MLAPTRRSSTTSNATRPWRRCARSGAVRWRLAQAQNTSTPHARGGVVSGGVGPEGSTRGPSGGDSGGSSRVAELERRVATLEGEKVEFWGFFNAVLMLNANIKATFDSSAKSAGGNVYKQYQTGRGIQKQGDEGN